MNPIAPPLLAWFYKNQRSLPFRTQPSPYRVWVSEIMLQQTRVAAALPYYERFMAELPPPADLADCPPDRLDKLWEGLGYYSRVRNLQKAARIVCGQYGGQLPADYEALRALPGVGDYTAGAIASISFGLPVPAVDGNVLRVFSRLYADGGDVTSPAVKRAFTARVMEHQPQDKPGDYNQALMELGALVCLPGGGAAVQRLPAGGALPGPFGRAGDGVSGQAPQKGPPQAAGDGGAGARAAGLAASAPPRNRAAGRAVAAAAVGRSPDAGAAGPKAGGAGPCRNGLAAPACGQAHFQPSGVAAGRL